MHVAACVQPAKLSRLQGAAGDRHRVHAALDWAHADSIIRRQPVDVHPDGAEVSLESELDHPADLDRNKGDQRQRTGDGQVARGRRAERQQAKQVAGENEENESNDDAPAFSLGNNP